MTTPRRIVGRLQARDFGVLAVEVMLVVLGILFALAIDRRLQQMEENEIAISSLLTLRSDLDGVLEQIDEFRAFERGRLEASGVAYAALGQPAIPRTVETWQAFRVLGSRRTLAFPRTGYDELLSGGNLRFLDLALRRQVTRYYELLIRDQSIVARNNEAFTDALYTQFFVGEGMFLFTAPTFDSPVEVQNRAARLRATGGIPSEVTYEGRLWSLGPEEPARARAKAIVTWASQASAVGVVLADDIEERTRRLIEGVESALAEEGVPGAGAAS